MNDWDIPSDRKGLAREMAQFESRAAALGQPSNPHQQRMLTFYQNLAEHRRHLLIGLTARGGREGDE